MSDVVPSLLEDNFSRDSDLKTYRCPINFNDVFHFDGVLRNLRNAVKNFFERGERQAGNLTIFVAISPECINCAQYILITLYKGR